MPQYFDGVPKYCAYGTYTHKHIPLAYKSNGDVFHVYTDNTKDDNFYVYAAKNNGEKVLVHTIENWDDPHTNAIIYVKSNGIVRVHISARGINNKFKRGYILESKTPYELDFECIDCDLENVEGYPQVWDTKWGLHVNYSLNMYDYDIHPTQFMRSPHYRLNDEIKQIVKGGHYYISYYDQTNHTMYVVYNWLIDGHPDNRVKLYAIKTTDGISWTNLDGKPLILPLPENSQDAIIFAGQGYTYLKDLKFDGKLNVLFTESSSADPTKGVRYLKEWKQGEFPKTIEKTNHNYSGAAYVGQYIITTNSDRNMIGGDIVVYQDYREIYRDDSQNCAYVRKVMNSRSDAVVSCDNFHSDGKASHYLIKIQ